MTVCVLGETPESRLEVCDHVGSLARESGIIHCEECGCAWTDSSEFIWPGLAAFYRVVAKETV